MTHDILTHLSSRSPSTSTLERKHFSRQFVGLLVQSVYGDEDECVGFGLVAGLAFHLVFPLHAASIKILDLIVMLVWLFCVTQHIQGGDPRFHWVLLVFWIFRFGAAGICHCRGRAGGDRGGCTVQRDAHECCVASQNRPKNLSA